MAISVEEKWYQCSKLDRQVLITFTVNTHPSSRGGGVVIDKEVRSVTDCDSAAECGVQDKSGSFNWSECIHPDSSK